MPVHELEYPKQPFNTVKRYDKRASYSLQQIHHIINTTHFLTVAFTDPASPFPVCLPMIGQMGSFERPSADVGDVLDLYLHGYVSSRLLNLSRKQSSGGEAEGTKDGQPKEGENVNEGDGGKGVQAGLPATVSATIVDGIVLALTPNNHSYNYRSATLFGHATLVTSPEEKLWAMELVTDGVAHGRWANSRVPPTPGEMASTGLLRVRIAAGSAKIRSGPAGDDRFDTENDAVTGRVWTGVVPVWNVMGEPVPGAGNRVAELPAYLRGWVDGGNEAAEESAKEQCKG